MTEQEFLRYKGLKTKGSHMGYNFEGGIVVGYKKNYKPTDFQSFIAFFNDDRGWDKADRSEEISFDDKGFFLGERPNGTFLYVSLDNLVFETEKEQKELDLTEILEGCEGVELFSEVVGVGELYKVDDFVCVKSKKGYLHYFNTNGRLIHYPDGNCLLWPSETCRDWSQFKKPIKVKDDDFVVCWFEGAAFEILRYAEIKVLDYEYDYVVRFEKFNPNLSKEELKKLSIV